MRQVKLKIVLFFFLVALGTTIFRCNDQPKEQALLPVAAIHYSGSKYAGSASCRNCHSAIYADHLHTAHFQTSRSASKENIEGSFEIGENELVLNHQISYRMTERDSGLYQEAYVNGQRVAKAPFHIVIGSGVKGQSYLYWFQDKLNQLPVSYQTNGDQWILSPGYAQDKVDFGRPVIPTCLTCHTTFAKNRDPGDFFSNAYERQEVLLGVNCESCHGPSWTHADFHLNHPEVREARHILNIRTLSRQQRLDACAKCHSGLREPIQQPFAFQTGDFLADFSKSGYQPEEAETLDVHGNQYGLLTASRCFQLSETMNCSTCHDPHRRERNDLKVFSTRCRNCHEGVSSCKMEDELGAVITENCIDCHMPQLSSTGVLMQNPSTGSIDSLRVRTHRIAVYEEASQEVIQYIKSLKQ